LEANMADFNDRLDLSGKIALVTGAGRGVGAAVARAFANAGASVVVAARDGDALERPVVELKESGAEAAAVATDVSDARAVARLVEQSLARLERLDVACDNAARTTGPPPTPLTDVDVDDFDASVSVNLRGVFLGLKYEIPAMLDGGGGAIVNVSSAAGVQAVAGLSACVSTKFGVESLTGVAALDYADQNIRVNAIAPGPILTDNLERAGADARRVAAAATPMGRIGRPDEVAGAITWLCSDAAAFVTGTTLVIDGGKLAGTPPFAIERGRQ
jgi:NAD(P)-dependent dehydrogenase (short-subunit alcohol dehydrogenase family)